MNEWRYFFKYNRNISVIIHFKKYFPSVLVKLAYFVYLCYVFLNSNKVDYSNGRFKFTSKCHHLKSQKILQKLKTYRPVPAIFFTEFQHGCSFLGVTILLVADRNLLFHVRPKFITTLNLLSAGRKEEHNE